MTRFSVYLSLKCLEAIFVVNLLYIDDQELITFISRRQRELKRLSTRL